MTISGLGTTASFAPNANILTATTSFGVATANSATTVDPSIDAIRQLLAKLKELIASFATPNEHVHEDANPHEVRDPAKAQQSLDLIKSQVLEKFPTLESVEAAGYKPTRSGGGMLHYTLGGYTNVDPSKPDGGVTDFSKPFSIMVENGKVVGVMLRASGDTPDFGAGKWHDHGVDTGDNSKLMHVWFDRSIDKAFGGHVPGFMPNERLVPIKDPVVPKPLPPVEPKPLPPVEPKPEPPKNPKQFFPPQLPPVLPSTGCHPSSC